MPRNAESLLHLHFAGYVTIALLHLDPVFAPWLCSNFAITSSCYFDRISHEKGNDESSSKEILFEQSSHQENVG
ncbi:hypothetical protein SLA2020_152970 [Shorea laevis]